MGVVYKKLHDIYLVYLHISLSIKAAEKPYYSRSHAMHSNYYTVLFGFSAQV